MNNSPAALSMYSLKPTNNYSEWQLQAVLHKANLMQYYEIFINQGGDDIDQIMQCDETEFLEIMSLVGMASKPLHVRRFQRTLAEFSQDRETFLKAAARDLSLAVLNTTQTTTPNSNESSSGRTDDSSTINAISCLFPGLLNNSAILNSGKSQVEHNKAIPSQPPISPSTKFVLSPCTDSANLAAFSQSKSNTSQNSRSNTSTPNYGSVNKSTCSSPVSICSNSSSRKVHGIKNVPCMNVDSGSNLDMVSDADFANNSFVSGELFQVPQNSNPNQLHELEISAIQKGAIHTLQNYTDSGNKINRRKMYIRNDIFTNNKHNMYTPGELRSVGLIHCVKEKEKMTRIEMMMNEAAVQLALLNNNLLTKKESLLTLSQRVLNTTSAALSKISFVHPPIAGAKRSYNESVASSINSSNLLPSEKKTNSGINQEELKFNADNIPKDIKKEAWESFYNQCPLNVDNKDRTVGVVHQESGKILYECLQKKD